MGLWSPERAPKPHHATSAVSPWRPGVRLQAEDLPTPR